MSFSCAALVGAFVMLFSFLFALIAIGTINWAVLPTPHGEVQANVGLLWACLPQGSALGGSGCTIIHNGKKATPNSMYFTIEQLHGGSVSSGGKATFTFLLVGLVCSLGATLCAFPLSLHMSAGKMLKYVVVLAAVAASGAVGLSWLLYASIVFGKSNHQLDNPVGDFAPGFSFAFCVIASVLPLLSSCLFMLA
eukprot:Amastigsp_a843345_80.p2 type:complete len:194 gc:universal Amastigsp_a843345_80:699-118(-)